jgi:hypothetical protein
LLQDSIRAIRIAAAELFISLPPNRIPSAYYDAYVKAKAELMGISCINRISRWVV